MKKRKVADVSLAERVPPLEPAGELIQMGRLIRGLREEKELSGAELCRRSGTLDPRTLTALEKGRIQNPTLQTMQALARGLGMTVSDLFRDAEMDLENSFRFGTQRGAFQMDLPDWGIKIVSFTPPVRSFFYGKWIFCAKGRVGSAQVQHPHPFFISVSVGRFEVLVGGKKAFLKEGDNLFFQGAFPFEIRNLASRDSVLFIVTSPSIMGR